MATKSKSKIKSAGSKRWHGLPPLPQFDLLAEIGTSAALLERNDRRLAEMSMAARRNAPMFNEAETKILASAIYATWNQIAPDAEAACRSNLEAVEACIDADRLTFNCSYGATGIQEGKDAAAFITAAINAHPYSKVLRALSKIASLV